MSTSKPPSKPSSKPPSKPVCSRELRYSEMQVKRIRSLRRDTKSVKIKPVQELFDLEFIYQILLIKLKPREEASEAEIAALNGVKANFLPYIAHAYPSIENHKSKFPPALFYPDFTCPWKVDNGREDCGTFSVILTDEKCNRSYACCSKFRMDEDDVRRKANVLDYRDDFSSSFYFIGNCVLVFVSHYPTEYALMNIVVDSVRDLKRKRKTLEQICKENMNYHITNEEFCQGDTKIRVRDCAQLMVTPIAKSVERLGVETTVYIFMSLLAEKRILVSGENVKVVSDTVQMFSRLLAPLEWPHTLIPIIPDNLIDLCQNPTPYLCGTLRHNLHTLNQITRKSFAITAENEDITMVDTDLGIFSPKLEFSRISKKERCKQSER
uniref:UDENN domain-containing protein n=1 Tax=Panagrolaimus superbus TaxID=310955 RepID=A0A914Y5F2_9BILA